MPTTTPPKFLPPRFVITRAADELLGRSGDNQIELIDRHIRGDWGELGEEDTKMQEEGFKDKCMLMSVFRAKTGEKIWVMTDPGWEICTILLPEDY